MDALRIGAERQVRENLAEGLRLMNRLQEKQPFSWARTLNGMLSELTGHELAFFRASARAADKEFNPKRLHVPFACFERDQRDLTVAGGGAGLVSTSHQPARDLLRPWSVTRFMTWLENLHGAVTVTRTSGTSTVTVQATEATQIALSEPTLSLITRTPQIAIGLVQVSRNLLIQSDVESYIERELLKTCGVAADAIALNGILATVGLGTQSGTALDWLGVLSMKRKSSDVNAQDGSIAFVGTPGVRELLEGRERAAGNGWVWGNDEIASCPAAATTGMPAATLLSGPLSEAVFLVWGDGFELEANPFDPALFRAGVTQFRVLLACNVAVVCDPAAFTKATSIT